MTTRARFTLLTIGLFTALAAQAQAPAGGPAAPMMGMHGEPCAHDDMRGHDAMHEHAGAWNPARLQAMQERHHAMLKAQLKLTPEQEPAWKTFIEATRMPAALAAPRPDPAEMARLNTPQRLDRMKALHAQRMAEMTAAMDRHADAVKAFYAVLTPQQQQVFDAQAMPGARHRGAHQAPRQN